MVCKLIKEEQSTGEEVTSLMDYLWIVSSPQVWNGDLRGCSRDCKPSSNWISWIGSCYRRVAALLLLTYKPALRFAAVRTLLWNVGIDLCVPKKAIIILFCRWQWRTPLLWLLEIYIWSIFLRILIVQLPLSLSQLCWRLEEKPRLISSWSRLPLFSQKSRMNLRFVSIY